MKYNLDEMCKDANANGDPGNGAYCNEPDTKQTPKDLTWSTLGFGNSDYARRFAQALRQLLIFAMEKHQHSKYGCSQVKFISVVRYFAAVLSVLRECFSEIKPNPEIFRVDCKRRLNSLVVRPRNLSPVFHYGHQIKPNLT